MASMSFNASTHFRWKMAGAFGGVRKSKALGESVWQSANRVLPVFLRMLEWS